MASASTTGVPTCVRVRERNSGMDDGHMLLQEEEEEDVHRGEEEDVHRGEEEDAHREEEVAEADILEAEEVEAVR